MRIEEKIALAALALSAILPCASGQEIPGASSATFTVQHRALDAGGGRSTSARFEIVSSLNSFGTVAASASATVKSGFPGQLNEAPVATADPVIARPGRQLKILKTTLLANDADAEGDQFEIFSLPATSVNGVALSVIGDWVVYDADPDNRFNDSFTYTVSDGMDVSEGTVNVILTPMEGITLNIAVRPEGNNNLLRIFGIPGHVYQLQATSDLTPPIAWSNLGAARTAPANGLLEHLDAAPGTPRFYRAIEP